MSQADLRSAQNSAHDIGAARRIVTRLFEEAGLESPSLDARLLIGHALSLDHTALAIASDRALTQGERDTIAEFVARRLKGEPVARIVGEKEFWGLPFKLSPAALVPRPDTETLVEAALAAVDAGKRRDDRLMIADLGVGSGAILLALLHELPNAFGIGTDRSSEAIATARSNAAALGLSSRAAFAMMDFGAGLGGGFDIVVSNPPYIASADIASLSRDVREHDPRLALDGGADGLNAYRAIARQAPDLLRGDGAMIVEIGLGQAGDIRTIFETSGALEITASRDDLAGIARALTFRRRP
ncbi:peptide chain release factor N(5)-glutamine methyltransferase [Pseudorhodoplanes sinuspersici]|uniref:Release factor glutamine methyltransferase n=1 Tax=Pseudorhodoplanes sinuspersici TaxID=1235591 RepID=A0A1W6ZQ36_9HYPH|nr:peptide chain release factor N(5)-glutamine methyltransferase [Pseudorhodoplanes sinuspersici]ARP99442.1 protein-(glutamine-N5) methyltransferase, release factor-specific [Pseudorhodoplanes sinuspersici]RKE70389.1 release factor glutamine methyltransferase [Pseudorhodoplanes sinuspersici]